jgi:hypothetical protein
VLDAGREVAAVEVMPASEAPDKRIPLFRVMLYEDAEHSVLPVAPRRKVPERARREDGMNRFERRPPLQGEATVEYLDGDFRVIKPGAFVRCAITGQPIPLDELRYWSVDLQEAYASRDAVLQRLGVKPKA